MSAAGLAAMLCASLAGLAYGDDCVSAFNSGIKASDPAKRIGFYTRAVQSCSAKPDIKGQAYYRRGETLLFRKGNSADAIEDFTKAIASGQKVAVAYTCRGFAYYQKEDYYSAIADFTQALKADPTISEAYTFRGLSYDRLGYIDEAIADLAKAKDLPQQNSELREIFEAAATAQAKQAAVQTAKAPASQAPAATAAKPASKPSPAGKKPEAAKEAAQAFAAGEKALASGDPGRALAAFRKALAHAPGNGEYQSWVGRIEGYGAHLAKARELRSRALLSEARAEALAAAAILDTAEARLELKAVDELSASARRSRARRTALACLAAAAALLAALALLRRRGA